jgi:ABC-type branched-subunit amino acid transport system ATPase component/ABC-type branched-subunit amino acid transport system permease subunit
VNRLLSNRKAIFPATALIILALIPLIWRDSQYEQSLLILCFLFAIMASGWNIISGLTGYVSLGHSFFLGMGMYTGSLLSRATGMPPSYFILISMLVTVFSAVIIGAIILRTKSHSFVIITIAVLLSAQLIASNWRSFTGGTEGLVFKSPSWAHALGNMPYYYMFFGILLLTIALVWFITNSRLGDGFTAIRDDEAKAASIGINTTLYKIIAYAVSAAPFGLAGAIYAQYLGFVNPIGSFNILLSVYLVLAALVGGKGTLWGPIIGGFIIALANEVATISSGGVSARVLIMGLVLVITVMFVPQGLLNSIKNSLANRASNKKSVAFIDQASIAEKSTDIPIDRIVRPHSSTRNQTDSILTITDVHKSFGGVKAVKGVSLDVKRGSITGLIGPNGSGKTTLFNCITGTYGIDKGSVTLNGEDISKLSPWVRAHKGLGRTFQITRLFKSMNVLDNLVAPLEKPSVREMLANRIQGDEVDRAREILSFMGLSSFEHSRVGTLSFGQQKLVEFAQILMLRPEIVMLDEPASGINPILIERLSNAIRKLNEAGTTFLIVEHNIPLILSLCDYVHVLSSGELMVSGTPEVVRNDEAVIEAYLGPRDLLEESHG